MVNLHGAPSLLSWVRGADFGSVVGIYALDTDKKDELQIAAGSTTKSPADVRIDMQRLEYAYRTSVNGIQDREVARDATRYES